MVKPDAAAPLLIKRYASRRLYNTETSDYVTLEDIATFIRAGREVKIVDLKSGDELTRQYLLQIIAEHEGRGENVLPVDVLTDLVRSYTTQAQFLFNCGVLECLERRGARESADYIRAARAVQRLTAPQEMGELFKVIALSRGIDAERVTAYAFIQAVLQDIREQTQRAARYQSVPLLVLDDLGSEPVIPNVSFEWLFAVINERTLAGLATVCSTNLTLSQLQTRYDDRFMSRLCDKNTTLVLHLTGENLRTVR